MDKIKNLPVFRLLAFAVALAIILGLSSVILSLTASAETADDVVSQLGTLGNYDCIKFKAGQKIDFKTLYEQRNRYNSNYVYGSVFGYKDGKFVKFTNNNFSIRPQSNSDYFTVYFCGTQMYGNWVYGDKAVFDSVYFQYGVYNNYYCSMCVGVKGTEPSVNGLTKLAASSQSFYDSVGDTLYLVYTSSNSVWDTSQENDFRNDIINNLTADNYKDFTPPPTGGSENGRFTCFGNYTDYSYDEHLSDLISESIEYTKSVSYGAYGRGKCYFIKNANDKDSFIFNRPESKQLVRYNSTDISFTFYNANDDLGSCSIRLSATMPRFMERESDSPLDPIKFLTQHAMSYYHFNRIAVISSDSLKAIPAKSTVTATLDLTGFTSIAHSGYYLIELVNSISGDVVSSVMFDYENDGQSFKQSNDHIDVKYKYDNGNITPDVDLPPDDTGHINGIPDGGLDSSNNKYTFNYQNPNITDIFGTLDDSINSISDFFQMCFSLLPLAISTIIIGGFALLVLLRVLGR